MILPTILVIATIGGMIYTHRYLNREKHMLDLLVKLGPMGILPQWTTTPSHAYKTEAGLDLHSAMDTIILPGERRAVNTDIFCSFSPSFACLFRGRSGLAFKQGIQVLGGVIDSSYRGEWKVILLNTGKNPFHIQYGDRIAQAIFVKIEHPNVVEVGCLPESIRGTKGFGSSGK